MDDNQNPNTIPDFDKLIGIDVDLEELQDVGAANRRIVDVGSGTGDPTKRMTNAFMGYNHRLTALPMSKNREVAYLTFFTRPNLNLDRANLEVSRRLEDSARSSVNSANMAIIAALDPLNEIVAEDKHHIRLGGKLLKGVPFDNKQAFIPILTNTLVSLSGFPDNTLDVYTSSEGIRREQFSMVDSCYSINNSFSLSGSFRNIDGDPITTLFSLWCEYMAGVYTGDMNPRGDSIIMNEIDYQSRIYRINTDPAMQYVTKIGIANAAFPVNDNLGAAMNIDMQNPFITETDTINIQFQCVGASYQDPIIIEEFNRTVQMFNPDMIPDRKLNYYMPMSDELRRLQQHELIFFNYYAYPHIATDTREISWWIYQDTYDAVSKQVLGGNPNENNL